VFGACCDAEIPVPDGKETLAGCGIRAMVAFPTVELPYHSAQTTGLVWGCLNSGAFDTLRGVRDGIGCWLAVFRADKLSFSLRTA
jgi:hypothetical protein